MTLPFAGKVEGAVIPDAIALADRFHHAGEGGFDREWDEDLLVVGDGFGSIFGGDGEIPKAVEVEPIFADKLWARVFRERMLRRDVLSPAGFEGTGGGLPGKKSNS